MEPRKERRFLLKVATYGSGSLESPRGTMTLCLRRRRMLLRFISEGGRRRFALTAWRGRPLSLGGRKRPGKRTT